MKTFSTFFLLLTSVTGSFSQNLLTNGNFEGGKVGFTSSYFYSPTNLFAAASYTVVADPSKVHPAGSAIGDHTTGGGLMLVFNGSTKSTDFIWQQTVTVETNRIYAFSGWGATWAHRDGFNYDESPPLVTVLINGQQQGSPARLIAKNGQWLPFFTAWNSHLATQATIQIRLASTAAAGNDGAFDDFSFRVQSDALVADLAVYRAIEITWPSVSNRFYRVQWTSALGGEAWSDLGEPVLATGTNMSVFDRVLWWDEHYYRVRSFQ